MSAVVVAAVAAAMSAAVGFLMLSFPGDLTLL
jgi:hypothetical protein